MPRHTIAKLALSGALLAALAAAFGGSANAQEPAHSAELDAAIVRAARRHGVPEHLVRRIVMRESRYNPRAHNHRYWGLMQISYPTARSMGFRGTPEQLLNPVTNLTYAVPYLANAFIAAGRREEAAVRLYASGYYASAKSRGLLGDLRTADSAPLNGVRDEPAPVAATTGGWSLFGSSAPPATPEPEPAPQQQLAYAASADTATAAPAQAQIQAVAHAAPPAGAPATRGEAAPGAGGGGDVAMVAGRDGTMAPPRRWQRDGGTTIIARGEQGVERTAASRLANASPGRGHHTRKTTLFARLDPPVAAPAGPSAADAGQPQPTAFYATAMAPGLGPVASAEPAHTGEAPAASTTPEPAAPDADSGNPHPGHRRHRRHGGH